MTGLRIGLAEMIAVRVPLELGARLNKIAKQANVSRAEYVRGVLAEAAYYKPRVEVKPDPVRAPYIPAPEPERQSSFQLFERGFTGTQIAAILKIPYRLVMHEIGVGVDGAIGK